jgi:hypothetical protein
VNTTRDKRSGVLYKLRRLPDRHLAIFPQIAASPLFLCRRRRRLILPRPSPMRGFSLMRRPSLTRRSSTTHAHHRLPPPASSAALTSAPHRRTSPRRGASPRRVGPHRRASPRRGTPPRCGAFLRSVSPPQRGAATRLAAPVGPRPSSSAAPELHLYLQSICRASPPTPPHAAPLVLPSAGVRVPRWPAGPRWGLALLTLAREMLASARILN